MNIVINVKLFSIELINDIFKKGYRWNKSKNGS